MNRKFELNKKKMLELYKELDNLSDDDFEKGKAISEKISVCMNEMYDYNYIKPQGG